MMRSTNPIVSLVFNAACWSLLIPVLWLSQQSVGVESGVSGILRPLLTLGCTTSMLAILLPLLLIRTLGDPGRWTWAGFGWSLATGIALSVGLLGLMVGLKYGQGSLWIVPTTLGIGAAIAALAGRWMFLAENKLAPLLWVGLVLLIVGSVGSVVSRPATIPASNETTDQAPNEDLIPARVGIRPVQWIWPQDPDPSEPQGGQESVKPANRPAQEDVDPAPEQPPRAVNKKLQQMQMSVDESDTHVNPRPAANDRPRGERRPADNPADPPRPPGEAPAIGGPRDAAPEDPELDVPAAADKDQDAVPVAPVNTDSMGNLLLAGLGSLVGGLSWGLCIPLFLRSLWATEGSNLRPLVGTGIGCLAVQVFLPLILLASGWEANADWQLSGFAWSVLAGLLLTAGLPGLGAAAFPGSAGRIAMTVTFSMPLLIGSGLLLAIRPPTTTLPVAYLIFLTTLVLGSLLVTLALPRPQPFSTSLD